MIYCILSDTHGNTAVIDDVLADIKQRKLHIDAFIHAGDMAIDSDYIRQQTGLQVYAVYGNCDAYVYRQTYKPDEFIEVADKLIWLTHGHKYISNGADLSQLTEQAQIFEANIVIYGHTHITYADAIDNIIYINPGSIALPRDNNSGYTILNITNTYIKVNTYQI